MPVTSPPTYSQAWTKLTNLQKVLNVVKLAAWSNASNFLDQARTYETTAQAEGDEAAQASNAVRGWRQSLNAILSSTSLGTNPLLYLLSRSSSVGSKATDQQGQIDDIYRYMAETSLDRVTSRGFTRGAFAAGSPYVGNGSIKRVWTDAYGNPMEACFADTYTVRCEKDQNMGIPFKGREVFSLKGKAFVDYVEWGRSERGSGLDTRVSAVNSDDSLLKNSSFADTPPGGDTTLTSLPGWTLSPAALGTGADYYVDRGTSAFYQESQKENGKPAALRVYVTSTITQNLTGAGSNSVNVLSDRPYYTGIAFNPGPGAMIGTLQIATGSKSNTVVYNGGSLTAALSATAGSVTSGTHTYVVTFVTNGVETGYGPPSNVVTADGSHKIDLTNIPLGPSGTTARNIYRTVAGNTGAYKLALTINDNTTTSQTGASGDNVTDGSLGAAVTTANHNGYNLLELPASSNNDLWLKNWDQAAAAVVLTITKTSGNYVLLDRLIFTAFIPVVDPRNGRTYFFTLFVSGATAWLYRDTGTIADSEVGGVIVQDLSHRSWGRYYPAAPATPTAAAPTGAQSATAGSCTSGTHVIAFTYVDKDGIESAVGASSTSFSLADSAHSVDVTGLPASPPSNVKTLNVYMSKAGTTTPLYKTNVSVNAGTTSATGANGVNVADGSLTVQPPAGVTIAEP